MPLTSIQIDRDKCDAVAELLGTRGDSETVEAAFDALLTQRDRNETTEHFIRAMRNGRYGELFDKKVTASSLW